MRYLCPAPKFHDWSDDQPDVAGGLPPLRFCPQHSGTATPAQQQLVRAAAGLNAKLEPNKEETKT